MAIENDIVLVYIEDAPFFFARVEAIWPDVKKDWFNVELLVLQIPLKVLVWTLKDIYINGTEFFMGGKRMKIEVIQAPNDQLNSFNDDSEMDDDHDNVSDNQDTPLSITRQNKPKLQKSGQLVSLADFQKKKK